MKVTKSEKVQLGLSNPLQKGLNVLADAAQAAGCWEPRSEWYLVDTQGCKVKGKFKSKSAARGWAARWGNEKYGCNLRARVWIEDPAGLSQFREIRRQQSMSVHKPHDTQKRYNSMVIEMEREVRGMGQPTTKPAGAYWVKPAVEEQKNNNENFRAEQTKALLEGLV